MMTAAWPRYTRTDTRLIDWLNRAGLASGGWKEITAEALRAILLRPRYEQRLLVVEPPADGSAQSERITIAREETWIGRNPDNHLVLASDAVGPRHARIVRRERNYFIEDMATPIGTWLNQQRVEPRRPVQIFHGDVIRIFPYQIRYQATAEWLPEGEIQVRAGRWDHSRASDPEILQRRAQFVYDLQVHPVAGPVRLQLDGTFLLRVISSIAHMDDVKLVLPEDRSIVEMVALWVVAALNRKLAFPFAIEMLPAPVIATGTEGVSAAATVGVGDLTGAIQVFMPLETLRAMERLHPLPAAGGPDAVVRARMLIATAELTLAELAAVSPGDVIVLEPNAAVLVDEGLGWSAVRAEGPGWQFELTGKFEESRYTMDQDLTANGESASPDLERLTARVGILVGEVELTLEELRGLTTGSILSLDRAATDPVQIVVNGKLAGRGELVEVENQLGVRIAAWGRS
jgi:flagellar motor switch/type III secretory pathway protein FliN